ncbi:unnamed protein product [Rotaria sp. Silwood2]|nr:unnamed protein product [Rotaria sp. Silwood2]CAF2671870.1 unnamed protein product [Rotaria sp. Silwood2]CAF3135845.1 unnamed protein product [Rotaria sp. Silwood2]CAF3920097.1 unnamed protein product [Rotaria sp. Silwood2]CAF4026146.1 unnamed protein product [Rotaria sp. Silwood2]
MGNQEGKYSLTSKDVQVLVQLSGKTENEIRQWYNEFHKESDGTDRMNKRQFQIYYTKLKKNPKLEQITDHIFRSFDKDHSGTVDFNEFLIAYIATSTGTSRQKLEYAFEVFDINENDKIEKKEAEKILNIICRIIGLSEQDAKMYTETVMLTFDTNQDKVLSKQEFIDGCLHDSTLGRIANPFDL